LTAEGKRDMKNAICLLICFALAGLLYVCFAKNPGAAIQEPDYEFVFENPQILSFDIAMSAKAYEKMQPEELDRSEAGDPERMSARSMFALKFNYAKATITFNGKSYKGVGVRYRGNASMRLIPPDGRKPLKLDFNRFNPGQTFHGFKKLNFINCFRDPSMLRDRLAYDLMREVGVPAPRATFANLYLTVKGREREHLGFFVVVEQVDSVFLQDRFGNSNGLLIKGELTKDLGYRGPDWKEYAHDHELKSNKKDSNTSLLIEFLKFVTEASDEQFVAEIDQYLNVDKFLAYLAMDALLVNMDSYAGMHHNWYIYYNTDTNRFEYIPWDVNEAFGNLQFGTWRQSLDFDIQRPYIGDKILISRILAIEEYKEQYLAYIREYIQGAFKPEKMHAETQRLHDFIKDAVATAPYAIFSTDEFEKSLDGMLEQKFPVFSDSIIGLNIFVTERVDSVKAQLAGEKEGYKVKQMPMEAGGPPPQQQLPKEEIKAKREELEARLEEAEASILANPMDPDLYVEKGSVIGELLQVTGPMDAMKYLPQINEAFEKAIQLDPEHVGGHIGRGMVRLHTPEMFGGDLDGAISDLEFVLSKEPSSVDANLGMGLAYTRKELKDKAIAQFEKVLELDPQNRLAKGQLEQLRQ